MAARNDPTVDDVRNYWQDHPLFSYEIATPGSASFFDHLDDIKRNDVERFAMPFWEFPRFRGKKILDVGCGPGWLSVQYAAAGAQVVAVDLTPAGVDLASKHLRYRGLEAEVQEANAESLPFGDASFDAVMSSGVLHHTQDTMQAFAECYRVLKPGGIAKITLYRLGILHSPFVFPFTRALMRLLSMRHPGADMGREAKNVDDFVRQYDGKDNPIGIAKTDAHWASDLSKIGFKVLDKEVHFFPKRFIPAGRFMPVFLHRFLDRVFGTMVYFNLNK